MPTRVKSHCPWLIEDSDLNKAESVLLERDIRVDNLQQKQYALTVLGQFDQSMTLGVLAMRCQRVKHVWRDESGTERQDFHWVPDAVWFADEALHAAQKSGMDITLLSAPRAHRFTESGTWE